ncbi:MAG: TonB-dependent receptor [bacterium]
MRLKLIPFITVLLLLLGSTAFGSVVGKITGQVTDKETLDPIVGATVTVQGTTMGAVADAEGMYTILNVQVGTYTLVVSAVGYATLEIANVHVSADLASYQDPMMTTQAADIGTVIKVTAEAPMVIPDKVASVQIITAEEIQAMPTRGFEDVVGIQSGVVAAIQSFRGGRSNRDQTNSPELYLRGGRPSEVAYYVDGFSQQDPLTGTSTGNVGNNAIKEVSVVAGGFPVEYGHVTSGIVNVVTQSGSDDLEGTVEVVTDQKYDRNWYSAQLGGPVPGLDKGHFFGSVERRWQRDRGPSSHNDFLPDSPDRLPSNWLSGWSYTGKLDYDFTDKMKLALSINGSRDEWQRFQLTRLFAPEHMQYFKDQNLGLNAKLNHTISDKTFFNLSVSHFVTERFSGDGVYRDDIMAYGRPGGNPTNDREALFRSWDNPNTPIEYAYDTIYTIIPDSLADIDSSHTPWDTLWVQTPDTTNIEYVTNRWVRTDSVIVDSMIGGQVVLDDLGRPVQVIHYTDSVSYNFVEGGDEAQVYNRYVKRKSSYYGFKGDITSELSKNHTVKAGFEFNRHTLRFYDHRDVIQVWQGVGPGTRDANRYGYDEWGNESDDEGWMNEAKHPFDLAFYLQDRIEMQGLIVTAGLRFDIFDYSGKRLRNPDNPLNPDSLGMGSHAADDGTSQTLEEADLMDSETFTRLSPRLGVAFPVSDRTQMRVSYGQFYQRPDLQNLYVGFDFLKLQIRPGSGYYTEVGNPNLEPPKTTAYEVGISHQLGDNTSFDVNMFYRDVSGLVQAVRNGPVGFFVNQDYGTIKGMEFNLKMRRTQNMMFDLKYTLSYASGTGSFNTESRNVSWQASTAPKQTAPLEYDQRHAIAAIYDYRLGPKQGPKIGDTYILENFGINFIAQAQSGLPYTPMRIDNELTLGAFAPTAVDSRNSANRPWTLYVDFKLERKFKVYGYELAPYVWVKNAFDRKNAINAWEGSGKANTTEWLSTDAGQAFLNTYAVSGANDSSGLNGEQKYKIRENDPANYGPPRQIMVGMRVSF